MHSWNYIYIYIYIYWPSPTPSTSGTVTTTRIFPPSPRRPLPCRLPLEIQDAPPTLTHDSASIPHNNTAEGATRIRPILMQSPSPVTGNDSRV